MMRNLFRCDLRIVSDSNYFFIETVLKHNGLMDCFSEINTNPTYVDAEGRLRILQCHDVNKFPSHGCTRCPPNMCKASSLAPPLVAFSTPAKRNYNFCMCLKKYLLMLMAELG